MSFAKAVNEIASLLTQGGIPSNHAGDIAARLAHSLEDYYNYRQGLGNRSDINSDSSNNAAFKDAFRSPEEFPGGKEGGDGKDGEWAWAVGKDGKDGDGGSAGQDGIGIDGTSGVVGVGGGFSIMAVPCNQLKKKLKDCGIRTGGSYGPSYGSCDPKCCSGRFANQSICDILEQQASKIGDCGGRRISICDRIKEINDKLRLPGGVSLQDKIADFERRIALLERALADAVDCPP